LKDDTLMTPLITVAGQFRTTARRFGIIEDHPSIPLDVGCAPSLRNSS